MFVWTSFFLILNIIVISSKFHERSILDKIINKIFNNFRCDVHDMIVRNLIYQLNSIY